MKLLERLINISNIEVEEPTAFGGFHLFCVLVVISLGTFLALRMRDSSDLTFRRIIGGMFLLMLAFEVTKQTLFCMSVSEGGVRYEYDWDAFPFQLCSVPMYLSLWCAVCRNQKVNSWLYECMFAVNMFGGLMAFIEPSGIQHGYVTLTAHAYLWHMLLIFLGLYLYCSKRACIDRSGYKKAAVSYLVSCAAAQGLNLLFAGKINCFYISPYVISPLAVFKNIYAACGWLVNMVLLILALLIASAIVYYIGYLIRMKSRSAVGTK